MSGTYGMPYLFEDTSGNITDSSFVDIYQRMSFSLRCTMRAADRSAYMIYDASSATARAGRGGLMVPVACLDFGANGALGTVKIGQGENIEMDRYLSKVSRNNSLSRKFMASDGQEYRWTFVGTEDIEWSCTTNRSYQVASYSLKSPREPVYENSSGCVYFVEEEYSGIAGELLASLIVMRHIQKHNL